MARAMEIRGIRKYLENRTMENANNASQKEIERKYRIGISEEAKQIG